jgi:LuxR family maltose regulon positive regulatory protein
MLRYMTAAPLLQLVRDPRDAAVTRPTGRANLRRPRLVERLAGPGALPLAVLVAPAGFGKTRLLSEWANRDPRPFAWVTLHARHDDPATLLRSVSMAVDSACAEALDGRAVLVLDNVHVLRHAPSRETIAAIVDELPAELSVALASRAEPPIPLARLRAEGLVTELRHGDLAMTRSEAASLLRGAGLRVGREEVDALVRTTEGWPAALSLAALSLADQPVSGAVVARLGGGDRLVAEYLRDEVLAGLDPDEREFVQQTAILDVLTAPLCDALLERSGSAEMLTRLVRSGFPLVALDRTAEHFRHHRLLSDLLRADLARRDRELEARLHRRASAWHVRAGDAERGLQHALAADEVERAGDLVWSGVPRSVEQGASATVEHWLSRFTDAQVAAHPRLALAAAGTHLAQGQGDLAEYWLAAAASATDPEIAGGVAALRAALGRDGLALLVQDAEHASALLAPDSPCQALCELLRGAAAHLRGDVETARQRLEAGARRAAVPAPHIHALCLTQLALIALEDDDAEGAVRLITRARSQVARYGLSRFPTSALVLAVAAFIRAQRGRVEEANADAAEAASLLERLVDVAPWYEAEVRLVLVRTALRLSDVNVARNQLAAARRLVAREPGAVLLARWLDQADADVGAFVGTAPRLPTSLTGAELRILQYLPTHLSFREIADRTFVSANTVKTQANAVYRKLDVRSRSEAVTLARELGLLDG